MRSSSAHPLISLRWIFTTLLVLAAVGLMIRLGFWQLARLEWRRGLNQQIMTQSRLAPLNLALGVPDADLVRSEYRSAVVSGIFRNQEAVLLRNQEWDAQPGYHLIIPLQIDGTAQVVLIDRGWIPLSGADDLSPYLSDAPVVIEGMIRLPMKRAEIGGAPDPAYQPGGERLSAINLINVERLQKQTDLSLLPVFLQEAPPRDGYSDPPFAQTPILEITEGPHLGYAIQWFFFAALAGVGYPFFVAKQLEKPGADPSVDL